MDSGNQVLYNSKKQHVLICSSAICPTWKGFALSFFFLTLGPQLPKILHGPSLLEIQGDVFLFGGEDGTYSKNSVIYQLGCSSGICQPWSTINQELKYARRHLVAIPVPDSFCTPWSFNKLQTLCKNCIPNLLSYL